MKKMTSVKKDMDSERLNTKEITLNKQEEQRKRRKADEDQSSSDENDHVFATRSFGEQTVDLCREQEDVYQNL